MNLTLRVNGRSVDVDVEPSTMLVDVLRDQVGLTGPRVTCGVGLCGTCTVLLDGRPVLSCLVLPRACQGKPIVTVEGLQRGTEPDPLQRAFAELGAAQCGYCTPGILCAARDLLDRRPDPTRDEIREALSGNLCRCTGYIKIYEAVELAARRRTDPQARPSDETLYGRR